MHSSETIVTRIICAMASLLAMAVFSPLIFDAVDLVFDQMPVPVGAEKEDSGGIIQPLLGEDTFVSAAMVLAQLSVTMMAYVQFGLLFWKATVRLATGQQQRLHNVLYDRSDRKINRVIASDNPSIGDLEEIRERLMGLSHFADTVEAQEDISSRIDHVDRMLEQLRAEERQVVFDAVDPWIDEISFREEPVEPEVQQQPARQREPVSIEYRRSNRPDTGPAGRDTSFQGFCNELGRGFRI